MLIEAIPTAVVTLHPYFHCVVISAAHNAVTTTIYVPRHTFDILAVAIENSATFKFNYVFIIFVRASLIIIIHFSISIVSRALVFILDMPLEVEGGLSLPHPY